MTSPELFSRVAYATKIRADYIVKRIVNAKDDREARKVVKNIDRLSDLLCKMIDMMELVRHVHPSKAWVDGANDTYDVLCEYMNGLNTDVDLAAVSPKLV
jgi:intermediate peptidase